MTKVTIYKNQTEECVGFRMFGHAGYAEAGEDIVCAAISVLTINTMNAIEVFTNTVAAADVDEEEGSSTYTFKNNLYMGTKSVVKNENNDYTSQLTVKYSSSVKLPSVKNYSKK